MGRTPRTLVAAATIAGVLSVPPVARALETDQYTPPPAPLVDIAPQVQQKVRATLQSIVGRVNAEYLDHRRAAQSAWLSIARDHHVAEAEQLQHPDAIAQRLFEVFGDGILETSLETWIRTSRFPQGQHQFAPSIGESIYGANPLGRPPTLLELSPTVNLFGVHLGVDKFGHFFQQGHEYYEVYRKAERGGADPDTCLKKAIEVGTFQERNHFGLLTVGVYSNADMATNYVGLKFFLNLDRPVVVNGRRLPPILVKRQDLWELNPDMPADFLRPYVTDHWNEALNPNLYTGVLLDTVRTRFAEREAAWAAHYRTSLRDTAGRAAALATFNGEQYGHSGVRSVATVADLVPQHHPVQHAAVGVEPGKQ